MDQIEAKLCAYLEGELDAAQRAEVETYLAANPQHRQLLEQLAQTRKLLRGLPHEPAPADLGEALHAQLERSVLLGEGPVGEGYRHVHHPHVWRQMSAAAAILVLTVGLGAVVYFVALPPGPAQPPTMAALQTRGTGEKQAAEVSAVEEGAGNQQTISGGPTRPAPVAVAMAPAAPADAAASQVRQVNVAAPQESKDVQRLSPSMAKADNGSVPQAQVRQAERRALAVAVGAAGRAVPSANTLFVLVSTSDPAAASSEVTRYLGSNGISWVNEPEGTAGSTAGVLPLPVRNQLAVNNAGAGNAMASQNVFVARNMNHAQVVRLRQSLIQQATSPDVQLYDNAGAFASAPSQQVGVEEGMVPGVAKKMAAPQQAPVTAAPANALAPSIAPAAVMDQLAGTSRPASAEASPVRQEGTKSPAAAAVPATQPGGSVRDEEPRDVVIVVQAVQNQSAASSQPASRPAAP